MIIIVIDFNLDEMISLIEQRKNNAYRKVNEELILLYLDVGKYLYELIENSNYGDKIIVKATKFMKDNYPTIKGFNKKNLHRMVQFYKTYKEAEKVSALLTQLSWTNNLLIMSATKTKEEREFYLKLAIKENYSSRELERQLQSAYYERYMLSGNNTLPRQTKLVGEDNYLNTRILDTYSLEFLDLPKEFSENDFKKAIIKNMKDFILEVGKDFAFISDEYRIQVGNHDFYIDLLFYNRDLSCLVAFELKLGEFKAEYVGKINLYLEALDNDIKKSQENPSVGVILCSSKDEDVVEYSLSKNMSKTLISEYKLKLPDKKLLELKLKEMKELLEKTI